VVCRCSIDDDDDVSQVSAAVCFLLSPAAAFINGETIKVDGAHSLYAPSVVWHVPGVYCSTVIFAILLPVTSCTN